MASNARQSSASLLPALGRHLETGRRWLMSAVQLHIQSWRGLRLDRQFVIAASIVNLLGMACIGLWVTERIKTGVVNDSAYEAALYMDRIIAPLVQDLATSNSLAAESVARLDDLRETWIGRRIHSIKIWRRDGVIAYSNWPELVGRSYGISHKLQKALSGTVAAGFEDHSHASDMHERNSPLPLIEIYAPVFGASTGEVIAVAEFYAVAQTLEAQLWWSAISSWLLVGLIGALMTGALYGIVWRGSRTIDEQRGRLQQHIERLETLLDENASLHSRLRAAYRRTADINERFLRRVSSDLHDGPAQLLSLGLLQLHRIGQASAPEDGQRREADVAKIEQALREALREVRSISAGLSLPDLQGETLESCVKRVVRVHQERTSSKVICRLGTLPDEVPHSVKTCVYRFVQEGLNNAFRHASGLGQSVSAACTGNGRWLEVVVADSGPGLQQPAPAERDNRLGLAGLRDRIETLGGTLAILSQPGGGTRLEARLDLMAIGKMEIYGG